MSVTPLRPDAVKPRVYIIDDDPDVRESVRSLAESVGLETVTFEACRPFLDQFNDADVACVIVDMRLPNMSQPSRSAAGKRALWAASVKVGGRIVSVTVFHVGGDGYELSSSGREPHQFRPDRPITAAITWNDRKSVCRH